MQTSRELMAEVQLGRLQRTVHWASTKSPFYQRKFRGLDPLVLKSLDDLRRYPFTTLDELTERMDLLTLPLSGVARIGLRERATQPPTIHMYTINDLRANIEMMTRVLVAAKLTRASVIGILGDPSDGGLLNALHATELLGATSVPLGVNFEYVQHLLSRFHIDALIGTAKQILRLAIQLQAANRDIADYEVRQVLCLNDTLRNPLETHLARRTGARVHNLYSSPLFGCIGMVFQCGECAGLHLQEDHFYPEIIAFGGDEPVAANVMGELVLTTLSAEAMPIVRARTGQAALRLDDGDCPCGSPLMRIEVPS